MKNNRQTGLIERCSSSRDSLTGGNGDMFGSWS